MNRWRSRFAALAAGVKQLRPDIICLQEVAHEPRSGRRQSERVAQMCELPHVIDNEALSILCRTPIVRSQSAALPEAPRDEPRQVLLAQTLIEGRPMLIANTHLAWRPEMIAERKTQAAARLAALARFAQADAANANILCGDFNDDPESPAVRLVTDGGAGFQDVYAACHPGDPGFTWSLQNPYVDQSTNRGQWIDYIFAAGGLRPRDCSIVFDANGLDFASDHFGVFCNLEFG